MAQTTQSVPLDFFSKYHVKRSANDVLPNGYQFTITLESNDNKEQLKIRELSLNVFDIAIDFGMIFKQDVLQRAFVMVEKIRSINQDGTVGKQSYTVTLSGKRRLVELLGFATGDVTAVSTTEDAMDFVKEQVGLLMRGEFSKSKVKALRSIPIISINEESKQGTSHSQDFGTGAPNFSREPHE